MVWCATALALLLVGVALAIHPDEVQYLPGLEDEINFRHYSGYLNASSGKHLHYWFVESQRSPKSDPVVLWMNGGPGCSSLDGFLSELGPFHVKQDGKTLYMNPFSWNKLANVIFLEAPAGVGYSYSESGSVKTNDDIVSQDNYLALQHFFQKFPQFKKNDFYITGESYGGIYVPTLSVRVLTGSSGINFKGFAVGNGYLDAERLSNSIVFFAYYHGLVGQKIWDSIVKYCCNGTATRYSCDFVTAMSTDCQHGVNAVLDILSSSGLNTYNLYSDCASSTSRNLNSRAAFDLKNILKTFRFRNQAITSSPPCIDSSNITYYLNQASVREALHIPDSLPDWDICSGEVGASYKRLYDTMRPQVLQLVEAGKRGLIYNGDVDMACNFLGDEWFFEDLILPVVKSYKPWYYNKQVAGFSKSYGNLTYTTIKGSGHMVPQDKPGAAFKMVSNFLSNTPF